MSCSFLLELQAIYGANKTVSVLTNVTEVHVCTDSLGAVNKLKTVAKTLQICEQIHRLQKSSHLSVLLHWIKGHGQSPFNNLADQIARSPYLSDKPPASHSSDLRNDSRA